jgi:acyl-CoA reductase-like NAD-dependent aldehyde dehydrogenase
MATLTQAAASITSITTHYIDDAFVESHGRQVGVAGLITAWNANALFMCLKLASAVAAGCTVVIKPSELSSLQARVLVEALHEADLPKGLLNVVTGAGSVVGAELVRNPDVAKISFTGSVAVGESIMRDSAATMKRLTLKLGGRRSAGALGGSNTPGLAVNMADTESKRL